MESDVTVVVEFPVCQASIGGAHVEHFPRGVHRHHGDGTGNALLDGQLVVVVSASPSRFSVVICRVTESRLSGKSFTQVTAPSDERRRA